MGDLTSGRRRGLSLIELLVVAAIIAIIMALILTCFSKVYHIVQSWKK